VRRLVPAITFFRSATSGYIKMSKRKSDSSDKVPKEDKKSKKSKDLDGEKSDKQSTSKSSKKSSEELSRDKDGKLVFKDWADFKPNLTPKEVMQLGSFGGTYFRPIESSITGEKYKEVWREFPSDWFENLNTKTQVASPNYKNTVNKYQVKCGGSLQMWEESGWITKQDPYGWFHWYCRFYLGRRTEDDNRQVKRWLNCTGPKGRWKNNLIAKCVRSEKSFSDKSVSPVVRQTLQHWGYVLTEKDYKAHAKNVKK